MATATLNLYRDTGSDSFRCRPGFRSATWQVFSGNDPKDNTACNQPAPEGKGLEPPRYDAEFGVTCWGAKKLNNESHHREAGHATGQQSYCFARTHRSRLQVK